ncbi:hypothetical protein GE09DRAFT_505262 [Coniochaeta sp. 2T2.1]|nr:hypothetical protein GE09DRAFT_505262 [Coniochaeta sp. 2T2.1]
MVSRKKKTYYAVAYGRGEPMVSSWGIVSALVDGVSNAEHKGFTQFSEARDWMKSKGCPNFHFYMPLIEGESPKVPVRGPTPAEPGYYPVASGLKPGVYDTWKEAEEQVKGQPRSKQKWFPTRDKAQLFIDEYNMTKVAARDGEGDREPEDVVSAISEGVWRLTLDYSCSRARSSRFSDSE